MAAQKTLIQQLQEAEAEARELQDFMQVSAKFKIALKGIVHWILPIFPAQPGNKDFPIKLIKLEFQSKSRTFLGFYLVPNQNVQTHK